MNADQHAAADDAPTPDAPAPSSSITPQPSSSVTPTKSAAPPTGIPIQPAGVRPAQELPQPTSLTIRGTEIDVKVVQVGIADNNAMEIPDGFHKAGWYKYGPAPGEDQGHAVIAGHVDSLTEVMPFAGLEDVEAGTVVTVERENARPVRYRVSGVEHVEKATLNESDVFARDGPHRLKVVTCGGDWLPEREDYEDNVVLTAVPL